MDFYKIMLWSLIIYGTTHIIVEGSIFKPVRDALLHPSVSRFSFFRWLSKLINCFLCTSVWVSGFYSIVLYSPVAFNFFNIYEYNILILFFDAMLGSSIAWFLYILFNIKLLQ